MTPFPPPSQLPEELLSDTEILLAFIFPPILLPEEELALCGNPELLDTDKLLAGFTDFFFSPGTLLGTSLTGLTELANVPLTGSKMLE